jgi:hypothetical protein
MLAKFVEYRNMLEKCYQIYEKWNKYMVCTYINKINKILIRAIHLTVQIFVTRHSFSLESRVSKRGRHNRAHPLCLWPDFAPQNAFLNLTSWYHPALWEKGMTVVSGSNASKYHDLLGKKVICPTDNGQLLFSQSRVLLARQTQKGSHFESFSTGLYSQHFQDFHPCPLAPCADLDMNSLRTAIKNN